MLSAFQDLIDSGIDSDSINRHIASESLAGFTRIMWPFFDPADYIPNWHIDVICEHLEAVSFGEIKRLLINIPPRHMKSIAVAVTWPAWTWAQHRVRGYPLLGPQVNFMFASYAQALSVRDAVKSRRLMTSRMYRRLFGDRFSFVGDQNTKTRFENNHRGVRVATSVDALLTGEGADIICVDDPHNVREAESEAVRESVLVWWDEAMQTRLNDPRTGAYVVIMQRVHERDLSGHILTRNHKDWTHLCLPGEFEVDHPHRSKDDRRTIDGELLWPKRIGPQQLATLKEALGSYAYAGQVQQRPAPREGGMFKRRWFKIVDEAPKKVRRQVRAWDLASTEASMRANPDWTVGVKMARDPDGMIYIVDMQRFRDSAMAVEKALVNVAAQDGYLCKVRLPQDPGQAGKAQVAYLKRALAGFATEFLPVTGDKDTRASPFAAQCEAGNVSLVAGPWNEVFLHELETFPNAAHDDIVDAAADAFNTLFQRNDLVIDHL